jgi:hypothetical protein
LRPQPQASKEDASTVASVSAGGGEMKMVCAKITENRANFNRDFIKFLFGFLESQGEANISKFSFFYKSARGRIRM